MIFAKNINNINTNVNVIYFIHIPKTSGAGFKSGRVKKLGHAFNVDNAYRIPKSLGGCHLYETDIWEKYQYPNKNN